MEVLPTRSPTHFPHTHSLSLPPPSKMEEPLLLYSMPRKSNTTTINTPSATDAAPSLPLSIYLSLSLSLARTGRRRKSRRREGHRPSSITNEATLPLLPPPPLMAAVVGREEATTSRGMREKCPRRAAPLEHPVGRGRRRRGRRRRRLPLSERTTTERAKERGQQRDGAREVIFRAQSNGRRPRAKTTAPEDILMK